MLDISKRDHFHISMLWRAPGGAIYWLSKTIQHIKIFRFYWCSLKCPLMLWCSMKLFFGCLLLLVHLALWWWGRRRGWLRGRGCRCPGRQVSKIGWVLVLGQARPRCGQALCGETKKGKMAQLGAVVQFEGYLCKLSISKAGWGGVWKETWGSKWKEGGGGGRVRAGSSISRPSEVWRFHLVLVESLRQW